VDESSIDYFGEFCFFFNFGELVSEVGRQLRYLGWGNSIFIDFLLRDNLSDVIAKFIVKPMGVFNEFFTDFFFELWFYRQRSRMGISGRF
jgi:hypothetical protein